MFKQLRHIGSQIYYSLPVQLVVVQIRYQKFILLLWLFLFLTITDNFGSELGVPYLFLEPEYMGEVNFFSLFLLGCGMGTFMAAYMIAAYINNSYRFHFLAFEYRPFFVFSLNNILIPFAFLVLYSYCFIEFETYIRGEFSWKTVGKLGGMYLGVGMVSVFIAVYFFSTNKNFVQIFGEKLLQDLRGKKVILKKAKASMGIRMRVDGYIQGLFSYGTPSDNLPVSLRKTVRILNQNHGNALFLEFILLLLIMGLGLLETSPAYQIPAGASILLLLAVMLMMVSAMTFWIRKLGPIAILAIVGLYFVIDYFSVVQDRHPAYGMNYEIERAAYTSERLLELSSVDHMEADILTTQVMLDRWYQDWQFWHPEGGKPKAVILCVSGGGLRSAYFATRVMQQLDSLSAGSFMEQTRLITGASGGMIGAAYVRELFLQTKISDQRNIHDPELARPIAQDLLNRVALKIVSGLFLPTLQVKVGTSSYYKDRGWSFDAQLMDNMEVFRKRRFGDYVEWERQGLVPQMVFSPVIINDGRKLYMSGLPVSYLTRNLRHDGTPEDGVTGIEFRRFFAKQDADSLLYATALRMNASFPFITPYVRMPSQPPMQLIDAGVADNYGLETATRYLRTFGTWFQTHTSGVVLVQIRDSRMQTNEVPEYRRKSLLSQFLDPIGATYSAFSLSSELNNQQYLNQMDYLLPGQFHYLSFQYTTPEDAPLRASLSWHLTSREVKDIETSIQNPLNQEQFARFDSLMVGQ